MKRRPLVTVPVMLLALACNGLPGTGRFVLCLGENGHVALEETSRGHCSCHVDPPEDHEPASTEAACCALHREICCGLRDRDSCAAHNQETCSADPEGSRGAPCCNCVDLPVPDMGAVPLTPTPARAIEKPDPLQGGPATPTLFEDAAPAVSCVHGLPPPDISGASRLLSTIVLLI